MWLRVGERNENKMEEFLKEIFAKDYSGTDDDMLDKFESWLERVDKETLLGLADTYGKVQFIRGEKEQIQKRIDEIKSKSHD